MGLSVRIGKLVVREMPETLTDVIKDNEIPNHHAEAIHREEPESLLVNQMHGHKLLGVEECPKSDVPIDEGNHMAPYRSWRTFTLSSGWDFFLEEEPLSTCYQMWRDGDHLTTNDVDIGLLEPVADTILSMDEAPCGMDGRFEWLKHWTKVAVREYGHRAAIEFA